MDFVWPPERFRACTATLGLARLFARIEEERELAQLNVRRKPSSSRHEYLCKTGEDGRLLLPPPQPSAATLAEASGTVSPVSNVSDHYRGSSSSRDANGDVVDGAAAAAGSAAVAGHASLPLRGLPLLAGRFRFVERIQSGTFCQVCRCVDTLFPVAAGGRERVVAVKIMHAQYARLGHEEAVMLRSLHAQRGQRELHIPRHITSFTLGGQHYCLAMELVAGPALVDVLHGLPYADEGRRTCSERRRRLLRRIRKVAVQLLTTLVFLERQQIVHADIKPENILFASSEGDKVKLIDFGNAMHVRELHHAYDRYEVASLPYRAPELLLGLPFGPPADAWALGVVLAEMWTGARLNASESREAAVAWLRGWQAGSGGALPAHVFASGKFWDAEYASPCGRTATLEELLEHPAFEPPDPDAHFVAFVRGLLALDARERLRPHEALLHPFLAPLFPLADVAECMRESLAQEHLRSILLASK